VIENEGIQGGTLKSPLMKKKESRKWFEGFMNENEGNQEVIQRVLR
jgi:hypothetical protein